LKLTVEKVGQSNDSLKHTDGSFSGTDGSNTQNKSDPVHSIYNATLVGQEDDKSQEKKDTVAEKSLVVRTSSLKQDTLDSPGVDKGESPTLAASDDQGSSSQASPSLLRKLTTDNLEDLNSSNKVGTKKPTIKNVKNGKRNLEPKRLLSAKEYIEQVLENESSQATSIIPEATERQIGSKLSLTKWQDQSQGLVEKYVRNGNSRAVSILMQAHCNPGTLVSSLVTT
jgi:hypothetical protein